MKCFRFDDCVNDFARKIAILCGVASKLRRVLFSKKITQIWSSDAALAFNDG